MRGSTRPAVEKSIFSLSSTGKESLIGELNILGDLLDEDKRYGEDFYSKPLSKWNDDDVRMYFHSLGCDLLLKDLIETKRITGDRIIEFEEEIINTITTMSKDEDKVEDHIKYLRFVVKSNKKASSRVIGSDFHYAHDIKIYKHRYEFWEEMAPEALIEFVLSLIQPQRMKDFFFRNFLGHVEQRKAEEEVEGEQESKDDQKLNNVQVIFCHRKERKFFGVILLGDVFATTSEYGCIIPNKLKDSKRLLDPKKMKNGLVIQEKLSSSSLDDEFSITKEKKIDKYDFVMNISLNTPESGDEGSGSVSVSPALFLVDRLCHVFVKMNKERVVGGMKSSEFAIRLCKEIGVHPTKIRNLEEKIKRIFKRIREDKVL